MIGAMIMCAIGDQDGAGREELRTFLSEREALTGRLKEGVDHRVAMPVTPRPTHLLEVRMQQREQLVTVGTHGRLSKAPLQAEHQVEIRVGAVHAIPHRAQSFAACSASKPGLGVQLRVARSDTHIVNAFVTTRR